MEYGINNLSVVIPNWNGEVLLRRHLKIIVERLQGAEIIVVDDSSTDGSVEFVRENFPTVKLIERKENRGFATTVNCGMNCATKDLVLLLNTDVEPEDDFLINVFPLFSNPMLFAVGLLDKSVEDEEIVFRGRGLSQFIRGMYSHSRGETNKTTTAWVSGGSGVFRREIWNILGGMDTIFDPFYWEDIDISYRAIKAGYTIVFEPSACVIHRHDEGAIKKQYTSSEVRKIAYRNQFLFHWRNLTDEYLRKHLLFIPFHILKILSKGDLTIIPAVIGAVQQYSRTNKKTIQYPLTDKEVFTLLPRE